MSLITGIMSGVSWSLTIVSGLNIENLGQLVGMLFG
jgi:hypothetical protein